MNIFFLKSLLSLVLALLALVAMATMFETLGRSEKRFNITKLMRIHRINGRIYFALYLFITYFCLDFILETKTELSPRATFHSVFALAIPVLLILKVSFIRIYRQFYNQVKVLGLLIALLTFGLVGSSGGYYLLVTEFRMDKSIVEALEKKRDQIDPVGNKEVEIGSVVRTDLKSVSRGTALFNEKCSFCHHPSSNQMDYSAKTGLKFYMDNIP